MIVGIKKKEAIDSDRIRKAFLQLLYGMHDLQPGKSPDYIDFYREKVKIVPEVNPVPENKLSDSPIPAIVIRIYNGSPGYVLALDEDHSQEGTFYVTAMCGVKRSVTNSMMTLVAFMTGLETVDIKEESDELCHACCRWRTKFAHIAPKEASPA